MSGSNSKGYDSKEYDSKGFDKQGYNGEGYDKYGYDREGYNRDGFNKHGYNRNKWDKDGLNNKGCYRTDYECCGNFKYKDEYNPDPYRHHVYGGDRPMGVDYTICDIHNHARCLGDPGGCKRMYAPGRERPKPITPYSESSKPSVIPPPPPLDELSARALYGSSSSQGRRS